jgi:hypothetical protein
MLYKMDEGRFSDASEAMLTYYTVERSLENRVHSRTLSILVCGDDIQNILKTAAPDFCCVFKLTHVRIT